MAGDKKTDKKTKSLKKETFQKLNDQLATSLAWLKEMMGDKKFETRIKKASKLLSSGIKVRALKKAKNEKKNAAKKNSGAPEQAGEQQ